MNRNYLLRIFQLEGYKIGRFMRWVSRNLFTVGSTSDAPPKWTAKARLIARLAWVLFFFAVCLAFSHSIGSAVVVAVLLWMNWYLLLVGGLLLLRPYEILNRIRVKYEIRSKVVGLKNVRVIGITGSYGKTSTKMVLHPLLTNALMTPKSYNTMFGIHKVVDYELSDRFDYFICEMGAYKIGDVKEFCQITMPSVGVLTGINEQHLERFGSLENTTTAKFEILQNLRPDGIGVVNLDNQRVRDNLNRSLVKLIGYSVDGHRSELCEQHVVIQSWEIRGGKTYFRLEIADGIHDFEMSLLGKGHLSNVLAALAVAVHLGEPIDLLKERVLTLPQIPHRLECRNAGGFTLLDNSYSSNPDSFRESLGVLKTFEETKVLITPGIVELGDQVEMIHRELGELAAHSCDRIVLVGNSQQTTALQDGMRAAGFDDEQVTRLASGAEMLEYLKTLANSGQVVLIENDLPDHYT